MKKGTKITLISLSVVVGLLLIVGIAVSVILSSSFITKLVNKEAPNFITCDVNLQKANLTFFKTFPKVGVDIQELTLVNPAYGAPSDTLLHVVHCTAALNIRELIKNKNIVVQNFALKGGEVNLFIDQNGKSNFDVFKTDTTESASEFDYAVDIHKVTTDDVNIRYVDLSSKMMAEVQNLSLLVKGKMQDDNIQGKVKWNTECIDFKTIDSTQIHVCLDEMKFHFDGDLSKMDRVEGDLTLDIRQLGMTLASDTYLDSMDLELKTGVDLSIASQQVKLNDTRLALDQYRLNLDGSAQRNIQDGDIQMDINYSTEKWPVQGILALIPETLIGNLLAGMQMDGTIGVAGTVKGHYNETQLPLITADVNLEDGSFAMDSLPLAFQKINTQLYVAMDLNDKTDVTVKSLDCYTGKNHLTAKGTIRDLLGKMLFDVALTGDLNVADFQTFFPKELTRCNALAKASVTAQFDYDQLMNGALDQMRAKANVVLTQLDVVYDDSLTVESPSLTVDLRFPVSEQPYRIGEWAEVNLAAGELRGGKLGLGKMVAERGNVKLYVNNIMDSTVAMKLGAKFDFESLAGQMDTINVDLRKPAGTFVMRGGEDLSLSYTGESVVANVGETLSAQTGALSLTAASHYNEKETNLLMRWNPDAKINLHSGSVNIGGLTMPIEIPQFKADLTTRQCHIANGVIKLGNSDFNISGEISDIDKYIRDEGLMVGNLQLNSNFIDINQIMDLVSGLGAPDSVMAEVPEDSETDPFMVPYGMDIRMQTNIKEALFEDARIQNIGGSVSIKDGVLVLDEMGLTSDAARLQLTALYKSPRKNHLFMGLDFHLLDIKIDKLIEMIPEVDTILPMLKSFAGNAEFHFAIETYLKSNYDLKYSTLRGAAAINGKDLVVLDEATYKKISKLLLFKKGTTNKIDSLSAEATIFKNEIDVYPFAVSIDKYQAVLSGRHNLDMTYNYNISLLKPIRLGLDIIGTDKRKFKLGRAKYASMFKPERQKVVEQNILQLKQQINQALKANVKEQPIEPRQ